jgi:hypothetical protein
MKTTGRVALWIAASVLQVLLVVVLYFGLRSGCDHWVQAKTGFDRKQDRAFNSLRTGMSKADVIARMGSAPLWTNSEFTLGQYEGNEKEYARTNGRDAQVFYTWGNGIDWFYCVGFDGRDGLIVKGQGGT